MRSVIILTAGGHGRSTLDVLRSGEIFSVAGFLDDEVPEGSRVLDVPVLGPISSLPDYTATNSFIVGRGKIGSSTHRRNLALFCLESEGELVSVSSPFAYVSPLSSIGEGTIIHHMATVNVGSIVGMNCIINSHALVEHDAVVGDHTHIATGAIVNGGCVVGENSFIGSGAVLHHQVVLPPGSVVSAGEVIRKSPEV